MNTIDRIRKDKRVLDAFSEGEDGYWVVLNTGYVCGESGAHAVHEFSIKQLLSSFKTVKPCACKDCTK